MAQVIIYTDGASSNNQDAEKRVGGWAAILVLVDDEGSPEATREMSGSLIGATNNQAELEAVRQALLALRKPGQRVTIVTDSAYVIGMLSKGWKAKENQALIAEIKALLAQHHVTFEQVRGHDGHAMNERADRLAVRATKQRLTD
ncbi:MAG: ribonuclease HI [Anaerolineae bacterium]|nr:ribonuclease HI [Anaerolineae bacterium]MDW8172003.1 ribonuclease H [Anaerolineae bacterium]